MKTKIPICYICVGDLSSAHALSLVGASVSGSLQGSKLIDFVGLSMESLSFGFSNLSPNSSISFPELHLMFDCGFIYLIPLAAGWSLSEALRHARLLSESITEYH